MDTPGFLLFTRSTGGLYLSSGVFHLVVSGPAFVGFGWCLPGLVGMIQSLLFVYHQWILLFFDPPWTRPLIFLSVGLSPWGKDRFLREQLP